MGSGLNPRHTLALEAGMGMERRGGQDSDDRMDVLIAVLLEQLSGQPDPQVPPPGATDGDAASPSLPHQPTTRQIRPNPLLNPRSSSPAVTRAEREDQWRLPHATAQDLHATLLQCLEQGRIQPDEMARFRASTSDATVEQELMWILFSISQLEKVRLRLITYLRSLLSLP